MGRFQTTLGSTARALVVVLISLLVAEVTVRIVAARVPAIRVLAMPTGVRERDPIDFAGFQRAYSDHLVPFRVWDGFQCNSRGFHDVEFRNDFPEEGFKIVALGDSFTFGCVPYWYTEMTLTEELLISGHEGTNGNAAHPLEVANLGVPASGVSDYRLVYNFVGRNLKPDLVLVQLYLGNDPQDYVDPSRFGPAMKAEPRSWLLTFLHRATVLLRERWRGTTPAIRRETHTKGAPREFKDDDPELAKPVFSDEAFAGIMRNEMHMLAKPGTDPDAPDWTAFASALDGLIDTIAVDGTPVVLVLAPSRLQVYPEDLSALSTKTGVRLETLDADLPNRHINEFAFRRGIPVIDLTAALRRASISGGRLYLPNDAHWSLRGNRIAATELAQRLVEEHFVP